MAEVVATLCEWLYQLRAGVFVECGACWTVVGCGLVLPVWQRKTEHLVIPEDSKLDVLVEMMADMSNRLSGFETRFKMLEGAPQTAKLAGSTGSEHALNPAEAYPPPLQYPSRFEERKEEMLRNQQNGVYGSAFNTGQFGSLLDSVGSTSSQVPLPNQYTRSEPFFGSTSLHGQNVLKYNMSQVMIKDLLLSSNAKHWEKVFSSLSSFYKYITLKGAWFPGHPEHEAFNSLYHMGSSVEAQYNSWPLAKQYLLYIWNLKARSRGVHWDRLTVPCPPSDYWEAIPISHQVKIVGWLNSMSSTPAGARSTATPASKVAPKNAEDEAVNAANNARNKLDHARCPVKNQFSITFATIESRLQSQRAFLQAGIITAHLS